MFKKPAIIEFILILIVTAIVWFAADFAPTKLSIGEIIIFSAAVMFIQSLVRDIWIKFAVKPDPSEDDVGRCMCLESTLGTVVLMIGVFVSIFSAPITVTVTSIFWPILVFSILIFDFIIKDFIVEWAKFRIRRVPNHASLRF